MSSESPYGVLPASANQAAVKPYKLQVSDEDIQHLKALLKLTRVPTACYENSLPNGRRDLGLRRDWLLQAKNSWENEFDWCAALLQPSGHTDTE